MISRRIARHWTNGWLLALLLTVAVLPGQGQPPDTAPLARQARTLLDRSDVALEKGDYPTATTLAQRALALARRRGRPSREEMRGLTQFGRIAFVRAEFAESVGWMRQAEQVAERLRQPRQLAYSYDDLGNALSENHEFAEAERWLRRGRAAYHQLGDASGESMALVNLACNELYQQKLPTARRYAEEAVRVAWRQPKVSRLVNALSNRGRVRLAQGEYAAAVADCEEAYQLSRTTPDVAYQQLALYNLGGAYKAAGRYREALVTLERVTALNDSINSADVNRQLAELNTRYRVSQQQARIGALTQQQRLAHLRAQRLTWGATSLAVALGVFAVLYGLLRRQRAALAASESALRQANATKDRLMGIIGHDLRAPLVTFQQIGPLFEALADRPDAAEQRYLAAALTERANAVSALVDNLLDWSRAQTGQVVALPQPVRPAVLLASLRTLFQPVAAAKGVTLCVEGVQDANKLPDSLQTDPNLLAAILRNLLSNALKFTPSGGTVTLRAERAPETSNVRFSVSDTGVGMPPDKLAAALGGEGAVRSTSGTGGEAGTGLGLAVCRHFAGVLGARWEGSSFPGQGTRWTLTV